MTGRKLVDVRTRKVTTTLPSEEHREMLDLIEGTGKWIDSADFTRQAIREKLDRWKREHPLGVPRSVTDFPSTHPDRGRKN